MADTQGHFSYEAVHLEDISRSITVSEKKWPIIRFDTSQLRLVVKEHIKDIQNSYIQKLFKKFW